MLRLVLGVLAFLCAISQCALQGQQSPLSDPSLSASTDEYLSRAQKLMKATPMIDGHNDLPMLLRFLRNNSIYSNFSFDERVIGDTDIPRLRKGLVGGQFWSVFVPWYPLSGMNEAKSGPRNGSDFQSTVEVRDTLEQIDVAKRLIELYSDDLGYAVSPEDVRTAFRKGKIASMLGAEGLHQVGASIATIRMMYELGVRYITLTHTCDNPFATSCTTVAQGGEDYGLTAIGHEAVHEMNRLGMLVDLSHVSVQTMHDAISHSLAPVIFSHSSAYSVYHHERNVPDSVLKKLAEKDGVVMINFYKNFVSGDQDCSVNTVAKHVLHVARVAGWKHVGIGSDFDGIDSKCEGLEDSSMYPNLVAAVLQMAPETTDEEINGFLGENLLRVWEKAEKVRDEMRSQKPSEAIWSGRKPWKFEL